MYGEFNKNMHNLSLFPLFSFLKHQVEWNENQTKNQIHICLIDNAIHPKTTED